jgi:hypothetical protein
MLVIATPQKGQHHDLYKIKSLFEQHCQLLLAAGIDIKGIFSMLIPDLIILSYESLVNKNKFKLILNLIHVIQN